MIRLNVLKKIKGIAVIIMIFSIMAGALFYGRHQGAEEGFNLNYGIELLEYQKPYSGLFSIAVGCILASLIIITAIDHYEHKSPQALAQELEEALNQEIEDADKT